MSNEEIATLLASAVLVPSIALPARRASIVDAEEQIQHGAELAVHVYQAILNVLEQPPTP